MILCFSKRVCQCSLLSVFLLCSFVNLCLSKHVCLFSSLPTVLLCSSVSLCLSKHAFLCSKVSYVLFLCSFNLKTSLWWDCIAARCALSLSLLFPSLVSLCSMDSLSGSLYNVFLAACNYLVSSLILQWYHTYGNELVYSVCLCVFCMHAFIS